MHYRMNVQHVQSKCIKNGNKNTEMYLINNYCRPFCSVVFKLSVLE